MKRFWLGTGALLLLFGCTVQVEKKIVDGGSQPAEDTTAPDPDVQEDDVLGDAADGLAADVATCAGPRACSREGVCVQLPEDAEPECVDGVWRCDASGITGYEADETSCDAVDNDCDGLTDEALTDVSASTCSTDGVCGAGGVRAVCSGGRWICDYSGVTAWEAVEASCDGDDNDCDGSIDEQLVTTRPEPGTCPAKTGVCNVPMSAACRLGAWECDLLAIPGYEATEAACDARDNDCDGETDEGDGGPLARAATGLCPQDGVCEAIPAEAEELCLEGEWACDFGAMADPVKPLYEPDGETLCDDRDNDCDGDVDEDLRGDAAEASCFAEGVCALGVTVACTGGEWACSYDLVIAYEETETTCDGLDNDCDGTTDNGLDAASSTCLKVGVCAGAVATCEGGEGWSCAYDEARYEADAETSCDNRDNDCDGTTDEGIYDVASADCSDQGVCAEGVRAACQAGDWVCDYRAVEDYEPAGERSCDGLDNDCDGHTDVGADGEPLVDEVPTAASCDKIGTGVCRGAGATARCLPDGSWDCDYAGIEGFEATESSCDNLDNDCDGTTDEDLTSLAASDCERRGVCAGAGVTARCRAGDWECNYSALADWEETETKCDAKDNDCDGKTDFELSDPVVAGCDLEGVCEGLVTAECRPGGYACSYDAVPGYEATEVTCDGKDNDCQGDTDENLPAAGELPEDCSTDGICAGITATCEGIGGLRCRYDLVTGYLATESGAACTDSVDNDCDGETDVGPDCTGPGVPCADAGGCESGFCRSDLDGIGTFCAENGTSCVLAGTAASADQIASGAGVCTSGTSIQQCSGGFWDPESTCLPATPVCAEVEGVEACRACLPDEVLCRNDQVVTCRADGAAYELVSGKNCPTDVLDGFCASEACFTGEEVAAQSSPNGDQTLSSVAYAFVTSTSQSNWITVWAAGATTPGGDGIFVRLVLPNWQLDTVRGVNASVTTGLQTAPDVAAFGSGAFVVVFEDQGGADGNGKGVYARRFQATGAALGTEDTRINVTTDGDQAEPRVSALLPSQFIVAFRGGADIYYRRFAAGGSAQDAADVKANATSADCSFPDVAGSGGTDGTFAIAWQATGTGQDVLLRIFTAGTGGAEIPVAQVTTGDQTRPRVVGIPGVGFAVAWETTDADGRGVAVRVFGSDGAPLTGELAVPATTSGDQTRPDVTYDATTERLVVAWQDAALDGDGTGVFARTIGVAGTFYDAALSIRRLSAAATGAQSEPAVVAGPNGVFFTAFTAPDRNGEKGTFLRQRPVYAD